MMILVGLVAGVDARRPDDAGDDSQHVVGCIPTGPRASVADLNGFIGSAAGVPGFLGADVGVDVHLDDGRSIWLFGDTLRRTADGHGLVHNSMLIFSPGCVRLVEPDGGGAVIPDRADGVAYWPMSAWRTSSPVGESIHVMTQRVVVSTDDTLGMRTLGPAVAVFDVPRGGDPRLVLRQDFGGDDPSPAAPEWGAAAALHDGWLYLYGTSSRDLPGIHGFALRVARTRPGNVLDQSRWRYWDGMSWQRDPELALPLIEEIGGVSQTLSVWRQDGRWYVLSKQDEVLGTGLAVWSGDQPTGPFGSPQVVADLVSDASSGRLRYMPLAHPELLPQPGTVVVSYSRNYIDFGEVSAHPTHYRPYFLRVPLP
jgi:hypothetical protein